MNYKEYDYWKSLGGNTPDRIVSLLKLQPRTASDIGELLELHRVTVCSLLRNLESSGKVESLKVGKEKYYAIREDGDV